MSMPATQEDENCGSCKFFDAEFANCLRYPPIPVITRVLTQSSSAAKYEPVVKTFWPEVTTDDWCGEYIAAK